LLAHGRWFSPGTPASSTTKTGCHDIAQILLKVALYIINQSNQIWSGLAAGRWFSLGTINQTTIWSRLRQPLLWNDKVVPEEGWPLLSGEIFVVFYYLSASEIWPDKGYGHYVIKYVSDLRQVGGFLWVLQFPPSIKLTATI
jgi:hypothetical protein